MASFYEFGSYQPIPEKEEVIRECLSYEILSPLTKFAVENNRVLSYEIVPNSMHWSRQFEYPWVVFHGAVHKEHRVLDVGGGTGIDFLLAKRARECTIFNLGEDRRNLEEWNRRARVPNLFFVQGDCRQLPFPGETFDRVFCISTLEHVPEGHEQGIREMLRVLKREGSLLLTMDLVVRGSFQDDFFLTLEGAKPLLRNWFPDFGRGKQQGGTVCEWGSGALAVVLVLIDKADYS